MSKIKDRDSKIEVEFRKALWRYNARYRKNVSGMRGKPDLVFRKQKLVIFIDSCFWHNCPIHGHVPKSNVKFWEEKLNRNQQRDKKINKYYQSSGWEIIRIWEHDLEEDFDKQLRHVLKKLKISNQYV
jgi:DNA mismatch endonuclease (patch repair protein)